jgi:hypothetical protein
MIDADSAPARMSRATGSIFFAGFGTLWMIGWSLQRYNGVDPLTLNAVVLGGIALLAWGILEFRRSSALPLTVVPGVDVLAVQKSFRLVNTVQWLLIFVWIFMLNVFSRPELIEPGIIFIVGVHLLPLARTFRYRGHYATGAALAAVALIYPFLDGRGTASPLGCLGAGLVLWLSALYILSALRLRPAIGSGRGPS